jgi:DNA recombination protein RmuC
MSLLALGWFAIGLALGALLAWLALRARAEGRIRAAEARAEAAERVGALQHTLSESLDERHQAVAELVRPLGEALEAYRKQTAELEEKRLGDIGQVRSHLRELLGQTSQIAQSLRSPYTRGRWGELTLRRTVELAGLSPHCDFDEQVGSEGGRLRPDMRVHLPGGRQIVIDAKAPLDGYLAAVEAESDDERSRALAGHAAHVKRHVEALASREYAAQLPEALDFVVLFLPHDALLAAACEQQRDLVEFALAKGVVFATPSTLFALLCAVAQGWREEQLARNAHAIVTLAQEMQDRLAVFAEHFGRLGGALGKAADHFNAALASFEARVLPQARRIRELGAAGTKPLPEIAPLDGHPREPRTPEPPEGGEARPDA